MFNEDLPVIDQIPNMVNQQQFAHIVGVSNSSVSQWVAEGRVNPVGSFTLNGGRNMMFWESDAVKVHDEQLDYRGRNYRMSADGLTFENRYDQVLSYIAEHGEPTIKGGIVLDMRCVELAEELCTFPAALNRVVNRAANLGLVARPLRSGSWREKVYYLTPEGVDYVNQIKEERHG